MPTILIVEDSDSKLNSVQAVIAKEFPSAQIRFALSVRSAIDALAEFTPDMIVADMSLPTFDIESRERGGTPRPFGGIEVFETLERFDISVPVLVLTSYPAIVEGNQAVGLTELSKRLQADFPPWFLGTVYFDPAYSNWEREVIFYLNKALREKHGS